MDVLALMDPFEVPVAPVWAEPILVDVDPLRHHEMPLDLSISLDDLPDLPELPEPRASPPTVPASPKDALAPALPLRKHLSWTDDELRQLERLVRKHGRKWRKLADLLPGRTDDAVRQVYWRQRERPPRYCHRGGNGVGARPHWTEEDDEQLRRAFAAYPRQWTTMREAFQLRQSPQALKSRAYRLYLHR